jgi:hypothetical protein
MVSIENTNQPLMLQQAFPNRPVRLEIDKVIPRTAIDIDDGYFPWATDFAVLRDAYTARVATCTPTGNWVKMYPGNLPDNGGNRHYRKLDDAEVRIDIDYLQPSGWMIELIHEYEYEDLDDRDSRILTFVRGNMPVLCSTFTAAIALAEACFPYPHYHVYWRSIF